MQCTIWNVCRKYRNIRTFIIAICLRDFPDTKQETELLIWSLQCTNVKCNWFQTTGVCDRLRRWESTVILRAKGSDQFQNPVHNFLTCWSFYGDRFLPRTRRLTLYFEDHTLSAVYDFIFNMFTATLYMWRSSSVSATWDDTISWWQATNIVNTSLARHLEARIT
jgi:hypothetical protein